MAAFFSSGLGIGRKDCKDSPILFLLRTTRWLPPMDYKGNILQIGSIFAEENNAKLPKNMMPNYRKQEKATCYFDGPSIAAAEQH